MYRLLPYLLALMCTSKVYPSEQEYILNDHILKQVAQTSICKEGSTRIVTINTDEIKQFVDDSETILKNFEKTQQKEKESFEQQKSNRFQKYNFF